MADEKKISGLAKKSTVTADDEFVFVDKEAITGPGASGTGQTSIIKFSDLKNAVGSQGAPGVDGNDGADGADGQPGTPGAAGNDGANGNDGADGANGNDGTDGINGTPGAPGGQGIQGVPGAAGAQGIQGVPGPATAGLSNPKNDALINSGSTTKTSTVTGSSKGMPSGAKWGVFVVNLNGNSLPSHQVWVFSSAGHADWGNLVAMNASDKSQGLTFQFLAPVIGGKCYIKNVESSNDHWALYCMGWI